MTTDFLEDARHAIETIKDVPRENIPINIDIEKLHVSLSEIKKLLGEVAETLETVSFITTTIESSCRIVTEAIPVPIVQLNMSKGTEVIPLLIVVCSKNLTSYRIQHAFGTEYGRFIYIQGISQPEIQFWYSTPDDLRQTLKIWMGSAPVGCLLKQCGLR